MNENNLSRENRIEYLDSLRGLAALAVMCGHYVGAYGEPPCCGQLFQTFPLSTARDGFAAVSLFFVLSGLVLTKKYFRETSPPHDLSAEWGPFYVRRIARIFLPFAAILLISAVVQHLTTRPLTIPAAQPWITQFWSGHQTVGSIARQLILVFPTVTEPQHLIPQDWTLTSEMNISFWMPFMTAIAVQSSVALVVFALVSIGLMRVYGFVLHFVFGILIAKYFASIQGWIRTRSLRVKLAIFLGAMVLYGYRFACLALPPILRNPIKESWLWYVTALGSALLIVSAMGSVRLKKLLHWPPLLNLGRVSYSFYLIHFSVLLAFTPVFLHWLNRWGLSAAPPAYYLGWVATLGVSILLAETSYRLIELPSIALGHRVCNLFKTSRSHKPAD